MWFGLIAFAFVSFWLGRKYGELTDLMLARRVAKLVTARNKLAVEQSEWEQMTTREERVAEKAKERGLL